MSLTFSPSRRSLASSGARSPSEYVPSRSPTPPPLAADSPRVGDKQGSTWRPAPLQRRPESAGAETYSLFRPAEVLSGPHSARLRRLGAEAVNLRLDDVYAGLTMPWQLDRKDVNGPFGTEWTSDLKPDFWVSTDTGKVCFAAVPPGAGSGLEPGQYHQAVGEEWRVSEARGDTGGFHCCCSDVGEPGSGWTLMAKLSDFGHVMGREAGLRVEFAMLVRDDCEAIVASVGSHDECRSLFCVDQVVLPTGHVLLADPVDVGELGCDGPAVPSGLGAGLYPVYLSRDDQGKVCRITAVFHPARVEKVCKQFPPVPTPAPSPSTTSTKPPKAPSQKNAMTKRSSSASRVV